MLRFCPILLLISCLFGSPAAAQTPIAVEAPSLKIPDSDEGLPGSGPIRRQKWFRDLWQQRRGQWASQVQQDQGALVFLGDSITQGWGARLTKAFDTKVANRGISGDTTRGVLIRLEEDVLQLKPIGVVLLIGTNDLEEGASPETIASNLELILEMLHRHDAQMPIVLCNVFPSSETKKRPADAIQRINKLYAAVVKQNDQVSLLDTWTLFADANGNAKKSEFPDLLHPNQLGYQKWAGALRPVLETKNLVQVNAEPFQNEPGFRSLFNGNDLSGWMFRSKNKKTTTNFDNQKASGDGRYLANHNRLIVTIPKEGRRIQQLWTQETFAEDFDLKLEFRATPNADSGIFIRGKQLQCRDYLLAGPYKDLKQYKPLEWNKIEIIVRGKVAHCTCNGEVLEEAFPVPLSGAIGLEGDRGQIEYRRIRIRASNP